VGVRADEDRVGPPSRPAGERSRWGHVADLLALVTAHFVRLANGAGVRIEVQEMGREPYVADTTKAALQNIPFYMTILFLPGSAVAIVNAIAGEREKHLDQGMFMVGVAPSVYWLSWAALGFIKMAVTLIIGMVVLCVVLIPKTNALILFIYLSVFSGYAVAFALTLGAFLKSAKQSSSVFWLWSMATAAPAYAHLPLFIDPTSQAILPAGLMLALGAVFAPISFSQGLVVFVLFHDDVKGGVQWSNLFMESRTGFSAGQCLLCMLSGTALQLLLLIWTTRRKSAPMQSAQQGAAELSSSAALAEGRVAVSIQGLRKTFGSVNAVDGLTVDFYEDQITSFLGHNGAGKSTTIQVLTGLHAPSGGDAWVYGKSVAREMASVRGNIGVCPQENVLWDLLTVKEHVLLFAGLRGIEENEAVALQLVDEVGLSEKIDSLSKDLSGGQQRKLQVALALVGDPKVIFLDEPTAGMDSQARRDIWKLLGLKKKGRSIVLTTHHMDEADILGDRIAVIDAGHLQVVGTSEDLKAQFAVGHHLEISLSDMADRAGVLSAVRAVHSSMQATAVELGDVEFEEGAGPAELAAAEAKALSASGAGDLRLLAPLAGTPHLPKVLTALQDAQTTGSFGVRDFGIVSTTLDDVFWRLGCQGQLSQQREQRRKGTEAQRQDDKAGQAQRPGIGPMLQILVRRRLMHESRRPFLVIAELLLPLLMIGLAVGLLHLDFFPGESAPAPIALDATGSLAAPAGEAQYELPFRRLSSSTAFDAFIPTLEAWGGGGPLPAARDVTGEWQQQSFPCFEAWLLGVDTCVNDETITELPSRTSPARVGALSLSQAADEPTVRIHYNTSVLFSLPGLVTYVYDALLANASSSTPGAAPTLRPKFQRFPKRPPSVEEEQIERTVKAQITASIAPLPMSSTFTLIVPLVVFDLVHEKASGLRHLQLLMGVRPSEYWLAQLLWDLSRLLVLMCIAMILIATTGTDLACGETFLVMLVHVFAALPLAYLITMFFASETHEAGSETAKKAATSTTTVLMLGFMLTFFGYTIISLPGLHVSPGVVEAVRWIGMCVSPSGAFAMGIRGILIAKAFDVPALAIAKETAHGVMISGSEASYGEMEVETAGGPVLILCLQSVLFTALCVVKELRAMKGDCARPLHCMRRLRFHLCSPCRRRSAARRAPLRAQDVEDDDVQRERQEIDAQPMGSLADDAVRLIHLRKEFPARGDEAQGTVAVSDLSLRMKKGECFALLGANGAGKSTTLGMLLRHFLPSSGSAYIEGVDVSDARTANSLFVGMGYVPQKNALFERLTGREMLEFFAAIRGVPKGNLAEYVRRWLELADITEYADRRCGTYSGGNKRKLSLAIALCGDPRLAVLDEPSAGVDPAARRRLWGLVNRSLAGGCTVALTTHHMDEAGHLGQRIGIMAKGHLACLGSPLHLRSKYGGGYELAVRMAAGRNVSDEVVPMIQQLCPTATVREQPSSTYVKLTLGKAGVDFSLVRLYEELEKAKETAGVTSYVANQADLEDVFLRILRLSGDEPDLDESQKAEAIAAGITTVDEAAKLIRDPADKPKKAPPDDKQLRLFAAYKQATLGDAPARGPCHPIENMKWKAWKGFKGMSREEAGQIFIDEVKAQTVSQVWSKRYAKLG